MSTPTTHTATSLSPEQERTLALAAQGGDSRARERLITATMPLVERLARKYQGRGMALEDLVSEGNIGLIQAVERYDTRRQTPFTAFAIGIIRQALRSAVEGKGRMVAVPARKSRQAGRLKRLHTLFELEHERRPSISEMSERADISEPKVKATMQANTRQVSVDQPFSDSNPTTLLDMMKSGDAPATDYDLIADALREEIRGIIAQLTEREQRVLTAFYGIGEPERTLAEIAEKLGVTRERARQIRDKGVRHMRSRTTNRVLRTYLAG